MVDEALNRLGSDEDFEIIGDVPTIAKMRVKQTPALVVNDKILFEGRIPSLDEVIEKLKEVI
ncbi:thioredoxin family protein [Thermohalobacter berrensis]|uniref:thioredoxin family protein n=1 Tax=Thermohalobacter berrensis TaxID=99594 RepID=UPI000E7170B4|nr:thioredoxin family protein [Thermohalobacter berrensis]